jgi:predicted Zn-dependent protease
MSHDIYSARSWRRFWWRRGARSLDDASGLEAAIEPLLAGSTPPLFKARALDFLACSLLFPPVQAQLTLAERSARRALALYPKDPTLHGTLGSALVELGKTEEARGHLQYLLKHSLQRSDRRLARKYLKGA